MARISATAWRPARPPRFTGRYRRNELLSSCARWRLPGTGPEDVGISVDGTIYTGLEDGSIVRVPAGGSPEVMASTGGRPLGIEVDGEGRLIVCDAYRGLLRVTPEGEMEVLVASVEGDPLLFTNNAAISSDGTIYFTDSSRRFRIDDHELDFIEHAGTGRLFALRPDGDLVTLMDGLSFANGVALARDESFLVVAETAEYQLHKVWLTPERTGQTEIFAGNLPGFPDNLSSTDGTFWCGLYAPRNRLLDLTAPTPRIRNALARLPARLLPDPARHGIVLGFDEGARVTHNLQDASGKIAYTTSATQHEERLFVGSLRDPHLAVYSLD
jgi:sugar lactone lactonase YvrE